MNDPWDLNNATTMLSLSILYGFRHPPWRQIDVDEMETDLDKCLKALDQCRH